MNLEEFEKFKAGDRCDDCENFDVFKEYNDHKPYDDHDLDCTFLKNDGDIKDCELVKTLTYEKWYELFYDKESMPLPDISVTAKNEDCKEAAEMISKLSEILEYRKFYN